MSSLKTVLEFENSDNFNDVCYDIWEIIENRLPGIGSNPRAILRFLMLKNADEDFSGCILLDSQKISNIIDESLAALAERIKAECLE